MKHVFIINPIAGKGRTLKFIPQIEKAFSDKEEQSILEITKYPGHATDIAKKYSIEGGCRIYSVGGDGTLNEVLNGIAGSTCSLAVIPGGSGNDFIRTICKNSDISDIITRTIDGKEKPADIAKVNDRYFINIASVGFDAEVAYKANWFKKMPFLPGSLAYIMGIAAAFFKNDSNNLDINIDGMHIRIDSLLAAVANGRCYGGGIIPAPRAKIDDGKLDICVIDKVGKLRICMLLPKYMKGRHENIKEVSFYSGKRIEINCDKEIALNIDGEVSKTRKAVFEIIPKGINIVFPKESIGQEDEEFYEEVAL